MMSTIDEFETRDDAREDEEAGDTGGSGRENVGSGERWLSIAAGSALAVLGMMRRNPSGIATALAGGYLMYRGATRRCALYDALGVSSAVEDTGEGRMYTGV